MKRDYGVDRVKAIAILCVVGIHCQPLLGFGRTDMFGRLFPSFTEWAVPAFFFVGGYVRFRQKPYASGTTRRWLTRLLLPYVVASVLALVFRRYVLAEPITLGALPLTLLVGSAWDPYYFVPLFTGVLLFSHTLARWPRTAPWLCALFLAFLVLVRWQPDLDPLWRAAGFRGIVRSPLFWWGYFFAGWTVRQIIPDGQRWPSALAAVVAAVSLLVIHAESSLLIKAIARVGASIAIPVTILYLPLPPRLSAATAILSAYSFETYLFHLFAVALFTHWGFSGAGIVMPAAVWVIATMTGLGAGLIMKAYLEGWTPTQERLG